MLLNDLIGQGELINRVHDLDKSINFLKMLFFLSFVVVARLASPGVFSWLATQAFSFGKKSDFNKDNPENYVIAVSLLLLFSIISVGVYLTQLGVYSNYGNPVLVNISIAVFFFAIVLVSVNLLQASLFRSFEVFNVHFLDVISFLVVVGFSAFIMLVSKWFLPEAQYIIVQSIVLFVLISVFLVRSLRLLIQGPLIFNQNMVLIFFYLCAAEISPFLIISKLLVNLV